MYNVLVVDDEQGILEGFRKLIPWNEYGIDEILTAGSGEEALRQFTKNPVDILITDVRMDGMNGIELIRRVKRQYPHTKCMIQSGYDDFQYIKEAMSLGIENYLLKPVNEEELIGSLINIQEKIEQEKIEKRQKQINEDIIRENILLRWVSNTISETELEFKSQTLDIELNEEAYVVGIIGVCNRDQMDKKLDHQTWADRMRTEFREALKMHAYVFLNLQEQLVFIGHGDAGVSKIIKNKANELLSKLHCISRFDFYGILGDEVVSYHNVKESYRKVRNLMNINSKMIKNQMTEWEMNEDHKSNFEKMFMIRFEEIEAAIKRHESAEIDELYRRFHLEMMQNQVNGTCWEGIVLQQLLMSVIACLEKDKNEILFERAEQILLQIQYSEVRELHEIISDIHRLATDVISFLQEKVRNYSPLITDVVNRIQSEYAQDINLSVIANKYKINSVYLGQLFKNEVGVFFSDYLNEVRIEQAKKDLENSDISVSEIGTKVGYSSKTHFYNVFKKNMKMTPTEYRRHYAVQ